MRAPFGPLPRTQRVIGDGRDLFRSVVDTATVPFAIVEPDGRLHYQNEAFDTLVGAGLRSIFALVPHNDTTMASLVFRRSLRGDAAPPSEHLLSAVEGEVWVSVSATTIARRPDGASELVAFQLVDIDRQKSAEEARTYSESRWNYALESAGQGVWDHDIRSDTMFYSRQWRIMRGMSPDEEVDGSKEKWMERIHPDDLPVVMANVDRQDKGDEGLDALEYRERKRDGSYLWILSRGKPVEWDEEGRPTRTIGTDTDVTRLKLVEQQLAAEKERLRVTLDSITDGMISTDSAGKIVSINPAAQELTGMREEQALGQDASRTIALQDVDTNRPITLPVANCLAKNEPVHIAGDVVLLVANAKARDVRCAAAPVRMPNGRIIGTVIVLQDVSESRALQRQLAHSALHDPLTGLSNRKGLECALERLEHSTLLDCLLYIDLDRFKAVNDTSGHQAGDALLQKVAEVLLVSCPPEATVARVGGDEFIMLLPGCDRHEGLSKANAITAALEQLAFSWNDKKHQIGASIGVAARKPDASVSQWIAEADAACYAAKSQSGTTTRR